MCTFWLMFFMWFSEIILAQKMWKVNYVYWNFKKIRYFVMCCYNAPKCTLYYLKEYKGDNT